MFENAEELNSTTSLHFGQKEFSLDKSYIKKIELQKTSVVLFLCFQLFTIIDNY